MKKMVKKAKSKMTLDKLAIMMNNRFMGMDKRFDILETDVATLKQDNLDFKVQFAEIHNEFASLKKDIKELNSDVLKIETSLDKLEKIGTMLKEDVNTVLKEIEKVNQKLDKLILENKKEHGRYDSEILALQDKKVFLNNRFNTLVERVTK